MKGFALALCLLPGILWGQEGLDCSAISFDADGDLNIGVSDLVAFLGVFGANFDLDGDGVLDCVDDCVGEYDACGVCNGEGPAFAVDSLVYSTDSVFVDATGEFVTFEVVDTVVVFACEPPFVCGDSTAYNGHAYATVAIGSQCWFKDNLQTSLYADGTPIPEVTDAAVWSALSAGARCDYGNSSLSVDTYGRLYNWEAVDHDSGLCPTGWHVASDAEWWMLEGHVGGQGFAGQEGAALKSTSGWDNAGNGTDDFGFTALPGGYRFVDGSFFSQGSYGYWWSSSSFGSESWARGMLSEGPEVIRSSFDPRGAFSVRCLQDEE